MVKSKRSTSQREQLDALLEDQVFMSNNKNDEPESDFASLAATRKQDGKITELFIAGYN